MIERVSHAGYVEVDLSALARNYQVISRQVSTAVAAVVKADGYGLGAARVAERLYQSGCRTFFVATLEEGVALRQSLRQADIFIFEGARAGKESVIIEHKLVPVLNTVEQVRRWLPLEQKAAIHVDTGMTRLGLDVSDFRALMAEGIDKRHIVYLMTHLACADDAASKQNDAQLNEFLSIRSSLPEALTSISNSGGAFLGKAFAGDLVRAGIGLYGGNPLAIGASPVEVVATLKARVLQIRTLDHPANVGYGATYSASAGNRLAVVGVGYADGYPRQLSNRAHASVNGIHVPVVGRVSMDLTCLDVTSIAPTDLREGDYVEMFGRDVTIETLADICGTINYEILTGLSARLKRVYLD